MKGGKGDWIKGGKGELKYYGKGNPRTDGWGYQGSCWRCGKIGHKANECQVKNVRDVEEGGAAEPEKEKGINSVDISTVWNICGVELGDYPSVEEIVGYALKSFLTFSEKPLK